MAPCECGAKRRSQRALLCCQPEDAIRDHCVTGVQTCALPIWRYHPSQIGTLYHGLRKIRAALREHWEEPWPSEMIQARVPDPIASEPQEHEADSHVGSARFTAALPAVPSSQLSTEGSPALCRSRAGEEPTRRPGSTTG